MTSRNPWSIVIALLAGRIGDDPQKGLVARALVHRVVDGSLVALRNISFAMTECVVQRSALSEQADRFCRP